MPITKSAKKALRQSKKRRARNLVYKSKIKSLIKKVKNLISENNSGASVSKEEIKNLLSQIYKTLDKMAKVGIIKKNTAARKKSRISKLINKTQKKLTADESI